MPETAQTNYTESAENLLKGESLSAGRVETSVPSNLIKLMQEKTSIGGTNPIQLINAHLVFVASIAYEKGVFSPESLRQVDEQIEKLPEDQRKIVERMSNALTSDFLAVVGTIKEQEEQVVQFAPNASLVKSLALAFLSPEIIKLRKTPVDESRRSIKNRRLVSKIDSLNLPEWLNDGKLLSDGILIQSKYRQKVEMGKKKLPYILSLTSFGLKLEACESIADASSDPTNELPLKLLCVRTIMNRYRQAFHDLLNARVNGIILQDLMSIQVEQRPPIEYFKEILAFTNRETSYGRPLCSLHNAINVGMGLTKSISSIITRDSKDSEQHQKMLVDFINLRLSNDLFSCEGGNQYKTNTTKRAIFRGLQNLAISRNQEELLVIYNGLNIFLPETLPAYTNKEEQPKINFKAEERILLFSVLGVLQGMHATLIVPSDINNQNEVKSYLRLAGRNLKEKIDRFDKSQVARSEEYKNAFAFTMSRIAKFNESIEELAVEWERKKLLAEAVAEEKNELRQLKKEEKDKKFADIAYGLSPVIVHRYVFMFCNQEEKKLQESYGFKCFRSTQNPVQEEVQAEYLVKEMKERSDCKIFYMPELKRTKLMELLENTTSDERPALMAVISIALSGKDWDEISNSDKRYLFKSFRELGENSELIEIIKSMQPISLRDVSEDYSTYPLLATLKTGRLSLAPESNESKVPNLLYQYVSGMDWDSAATSVLFQSNEMYSYFLQAIPSMIAAGEGKKVLIEDDKVYYLVRYFLGNEPAKDIFFEFFAQRIKQCRKTEATAILAMLEDVKERLIESRPKEQA